MNTTEAPGIAIREEALAALDDVREREKAAMVPIAESAFAKFFGYSLPGTYLKEGYLDKPAVIFDLEDGLSVWRFGRRVKQPHTSTGRRKTGRLRSEFHLVGPCSTKKCARPRFIGEVESRVALGRLLDNLDDGYCMECRQAEPA